MNSLPWIGKLIGCLGAEAFIERTGYKKTMYAAGVIQIIAIIGETDHCASTSERVLTDL
jgi:hypothetical protein